MIRRFTLLTIGVLCFLLQSQASFAQTYKFNSSPKGVQLPVQNVLQIEQDTLGQMWFSTTRGVVYSDGIQTYELPDTLLRKFAFRVSILKDGDGVMWLYNASGFPVVFQGTEIGWNEFDFDPAYKEQTSSNIYFYSIGKKSEKVFIMDTGKKLLFWRNGEKSAEEIPRDFDKTGVLLSVVDLDGKPLLNFQKGAFLLENKFLKAYQFRGIPLPSPPLLVKKSPKGDYYFLGNNYLAKGTAAEFPVEMIDENFASFDVNGVPYFSLDFDAENVFYHFNSHFKKYNPKRPRPLLIDLAYLLRSRIVQTLLVDREGILWLGSSRGLVNNNSQLFQNYGLESPGFLGEEITAIEDLGGSNFLFGFNNGVQLFNRYGIETLLEDNSPYGDPKERIINFSKSANGDVIFSANYGGVGIFDPSTQKIKMVSPGPTVNVSFVDFDGDSVFVTSGERIFHTSFASLKRGDFGTELTEELKDLWKSGGIFYRKAARLKNGKILVLRASKLENQYPIIETEKYLLAEGYDYKEMPDGSILLGTEYGLKVFRDGYVGYYTYADHTISNPVYAIMLENNGCVWAGSDDGVYVLGKGKFHHFNESNGLVGNEINRGALIQAESGRILIGTQKGFSLYFPEESSYAKGSPQIFLKDITVGEEHLTEGGRSEFSFQQNSVKVNFSAPAFDESRELWIHYRIVDSDSSAWQIMREPRTNELYFPNLPAGNYRIELKASYNGEDFTETVASQGFTILRPFYLQGWFLFLAVLVLIGIGVLINVIYRQVKNVGVLRSEVDRNTKDRFLAEQQFKNVWASSQDGMILVLNSETILTVNPAFAKIMGLEIHDLENQSVRDLFIPGFVNEKYLEVLHSQLYQKGGKGFSIELPISWKTGTLEMEVFFVLLEKDFSGKELVLCVFKDITAQKLTEKNLKEARNRAEEANRFKTSLLSNISHEVRTPLNGIIGGAEHIMMIRKEDQELQSMLDIILQSGERLLETISSILDLAKIEANKMPVVYIKTKINAFICDVTKQHKSQAERKGLSMEVDFASPEAEGRIDKRFLEIILNNVLSNSIKYTKKGAIRLKVIHDGRFLSFEVKDTGIGMSAEFQKKMFDPFEQESSGNDRLFDGSGLGLSITKNLVQLLRGKIYIESDKESGTKVLVEIPLPEG